MHITLAFLNQSFFFKCVKVRAFKSQHGKCSHVGANAAFLCLIGTSGVDFWVQNSRYVERLHSQRLKHWRLMRNRKVTYKHMKEESYACREALWTLAFLIIFLFGVSWTQVNDLVLLIHSTHKRLILSVQCFISHHVCGDDCTEDYSKMGEITWEEHILLRWTDYDGSTERSILPDLISHHRDMLSVLRLWVSALVVFMCSCMHACTMRALPL